MNLKKESGKDCENGFDPKLVQDEPKPTKQDIVEESKVDCFV